MTKPTSPADSGVPTARLGREHADLLDQVGGAAGHQQDLVLRFDHAVDDAHQHDDADVVVEPGIDDQRLQGRRGVALGRRDPFDDPRQDLLQPHAGLGARQHRVMGVQADDILDLGACFLSVGRGQVHLVQDRQNLDAELDRRVAVGDRLRLDALRGIDHQQRSLTGRKRPADLVAEVDVPRGVDQVQVVLLAIRGDVFQRRGLRLDRDATLALEVHRVQHLRLHLAVGQAAAALDQAIRERRLAVVDMRDDGKVADMLHASCAEPVGLGYQRCKSWRQLRGSARLNKEKGVTARRTPTPGTAAEFTAARELAGSAANDDEP